MNIRPWEKSCVRRWGEYKIMHRQCICFFKKPLWNALHIVSTVLIVTMSVDIHQRWYYTSSDSSCISYSPSDSHHSYNSVSIWGSHGYVDSRSNHCVPTQLIFHAAIRTWCEKDNTWVYCSTQNAATNRQQIHCLKQNLSSESIMVHLCIKANKRRFQNSMDAKA